MIIQTDRKINLANFKRKQAELFGAKRSDRNKAQGFYAPINLVRYKALMIVVNADFKSLSVFSTSKQKKTRGKTPGFS